MDLRFHLLTENYLASLLVDTVPRQSLGRRERWIVEGYIVRICKVRKQDRQLFPCRADRRERRDKTKKDTGLQRRLSLKIFCFGLS